MAHSLRPVPKLIEIRSVHSQIREPERNRISPLLVQFLSSRPWHLRGSWNLLACLWCRLTEANSGCVPNVGLMSNVESALQLW